MKISLIGSAGGVGQAMALLLKTQLPEGTELCLIDRNPSNPGVAVDLSHIPTSVKTTGYKLDDINEGLKGSDIVIITAGSPRKPGMTRDDLFQINASIIRDLSEKVAENCPKAFLCIVTNPMNSMTVVAAKTLEKAGVFNPKKLCGVTALDMVRAQTFIGEVAGKRPEEINIDIIGGHSGTTILPLLSQVEGIDLSEEEQKKLIQRIQNAGTEVVEAKAGAGSATLSMGYAGCVFLEALVKGLCGEETRICAYIQTEQEKTKFFAKPVMIGPEGIKEEVSYGELDEIEQEALNELIPLLNAAIEKGEKFINES